MREASLGCRENTRIRAAPAGDWWRLQQTSDSGEPTADAGGKDALRPKRTGKVI